MKFNRRMERYLQDLRSREVEAVVPPRGLDVQIVEAGGCFLLRGFVSKPRYRRCCAHEKLIAGPVRDAHVGSMKGDHTGAEDRSRAAPAGRQPSQNAEQRRPVIGVIGDGQPGSERERMAAEIGGELARAGVHLVCGGLGGCMEGASRGYKEANGEGICLGLLPGMLRAEANPWVDLAIPTGVNSAQGALVAMAVDAAIVLGGGGGTLSEVGLLW